MQRLRPQYRSLTSRAGRARAILCRDVGTLAPAVPHEAVSEKPGIQFHMDAARAPPRPDCSSEGRRLGEN
eukprot:1768130-Lingulodinium_polyedra.AAC.1